MSEVDETALDRAARAIEAADALLIGAGAGMGVDSGLPDFRGPEGFWRAYPPYAKLGLRFEAIANPAHFRNDPPLAWGFYGHRTNLYRQTTPHEGFAILRRWGERMKHGAFAFTSNVDDHFARAGFDPDRIVECHGSIVWRQCLVRLRRRDLPRRRGRGPSRPDNIPGPRPPSDLPQVRPPGPAQHPDVRRPGVGLKSDRRAESPDRGMADRTRPDQPRSHGVRRRDGDPVRPPLL